jgi:anti-anti-sigma factor
MNIDLSYDEYTVNITISGSIDSAGGTLIGEKFQEVIDYPRIIKNVNLDLKGVSTINSAGIGKLLKFYKHFDKLGGVFKITHISDNLLTLFKDINLDKIIQISK